ncbi:MAG: TonB family protein [Solidesulfovibrio sp.]|jgi:protein TonB|uniref:TonB family protein n=1 Tax=Solidesulfovibrio sp. TaxID=2910990 RepID=UPI002B1EB149|nr:TonB family protein [Solidesulfovibrio sp.]MEA4856170.1 TonB family protein [Solidesulfovibrio sp.]
MTYAERIGTGLAVSLFAHFLILTTHFAPASGQAASDTYIDMAGASVIVNDTEYAGLGIDSYSPQAESATDTADRRRQAFLKFLDDIEEAVHARRPDVSGSRFLGVAVYGFSIRRDGTFTEPVLTASSGNPELDRAAARAIRAASGAVKRPPLLGGGSIPVVLHVKYQYDLR